MHLETTYLNRYVELFEGLYGDERHKEFQALSRLYNHLLGPVGSLQLHRPDLVDFSMYTSSCTHSPVARLMLDLADRCPEADGMRIPGGGKGGGMQQPVLGALGEMSERLLAVLHFQAVRDELEWGTQEELVRNGQRALGPEELPLFAPEQYAAADFPFTPFSSTAKLCWIRGVELLTGEPAWAPAQLVLLYYKHRAGEPVIGYPTSGGLGFATDRRRAILHGLFEFIERDAINVCWFCRLAPSLVEVDLGRILAERWHLGHWRLSTPAIDRINVYLNTLDVPVPVFTVLAQDTSRLDRALLAAGGAAATRQRALEQALFELGQTRAVLNSYQPRGIKVIRADSVTSEMTDFLDGAIYFGHASNLSRLDWYTRGGRVVHWNDVPSATEENDERTLDAMLRWLHTTSLRPIVFDLDRACWPEVHLVRAIVPQLTLASVPAHPYLGHTRYYELPRRLGLSGHRLSYADLNSDPIPFP